jgi:hypothetical protein
VGQMDAIHVYHLLEQELGTSWVTLQSGAGQEWHADSTSSYCVWSQERREWEIISVFSWPHRLEPASRTMPSEDSSTKIVPTSADYDFNDELTPNA